MTSPHVAAVALLVLGCVPREPSTAARTTANVVHDVGAAATRVLDACSAELERQRIRRAPAAEVEDTIATCDRVLEARRLVRHTHAALRGAIVVAEAAEDLGQAPDWRPVAAAAHAAIRASQELRAAVEAAQRIGATP